MVAMVDSRCVVELDSTTEHKFSRHLVVIVPGAAFASNAQVGAFVRELCAVAESRRPDDPAVAALFLKKVRGCCHTAPLYPIYTLRDTIS